MPSHAANMGMLEPRHLDSYKLKDPGGVGFLIQHVIRGISGDMRTRGITSFNPWLPSGIPPGYKDFESRSHYSERPSRPD